MMQLVLLLAATGVDYGWQKTPDGSLEYLIQIEPALLRALADGESIVSEIHPDARGVTRFRVFVGNGRLPREAVPAVAPQPPVGQVEAPIDARLLPGPEPSPEPRQNTLPPMNPPVDSRAANNGALLPPLQPPATSRAGDAQLAPPNIAPAAPVQPPAVADNRFPGDSRFGSGFRPSEPPRPFPVEASRDPNVRPAGAVTAPTSSPVSSRGGERLVASAATPKPSTSEATDAANDDAETGVASSAPLIITVALLFLSLGANVFLGWIARGFYTRYRALADEIRHAPSVEPA